LTAAGLADAGFEAWREFGELADRRRLQIFERRRGCEISVKRKVY